MRKSWIIFLIALVVLSGCTSSVSNPYNSGVLMQDPQSYILTKQNPFPDSSTQIRFDVVNYGQEPVPRAEIKFFDTAGLKVSNLDCQGGTRTDTYTCVFNNIASLDKRHVEITLATPAAAQILSPTDFTIAYSISFDYSGFRRMTIPIFDYSKENQPETKYSISDPPVSPIEVDFDPPVGSITKQGNQEITEYYAAKGDPFEVRMTFKQAVQTEVPTNITGDQIKLNLLGLNIDPSSYCDFNSDLTAKNTLSVTQSPVALSCYFVSQPFSTAEMTGTVDISYAFTFTVIKTETISVVPRGTVTQTTSAAEGGNNIAP